MTQPSDRTIRELVNDLYHRLDIGSRPRSAEARLLEQITLAADALEARVDRLQRAVLAHEDGHDDAAMAAAIVACMDHGDLPP